MSDDHSAATLLTPGTTVEVLNPAGAADVVLACEHASHFIPEQLDGLGLSAEVQVSHVAWDPGALKVAVLLSQMINAPLVAQKVSRLVYDCNRPPEADSSIPARSEIYDIPGNHNLSVSERDMRASAYYAPFCTSLSSTLDAKSAGNARPALVTIHSFTPVYLGQRRDVEIGILHDTDSRLADALLALMTAEGRYDIRRNEPYGPADGVTHTLKQHGLTRGLLNVMIEIRNDLIGNAAEQAIMAHWLGNHLIKSLGALAPDTSMERSAH